MKWDNVKKENSDTDSIEKLPLSKDKLSIQSRLNMNSFMVIGIIILSVVIATGIGISFIHDNITTGFFSSGTIHNKKLPIYCVDQKEPKVALTFDAAWGNEDTKTILKILKKHDVHVTFFMTGGWVEAYPDDVKAISKAGHELGNHSENHKQMSTLSADQCKDEIMKVHEKVKKLTGIEMTDFRPPYGDYNDTLITAAAECGYHPIQWDVDTLVAKTKIF